MRNPGPAISTLARCGTCRGVELLLDPLGDVAGAAAHDAAELQRHVRSPVAVLATPGRFDLDAAGRLGESGALERATERTAEVVSDHGYEITKAGTVARVRESYLVAGERPPVVKEEAADRFARGARVDMLPLQRIPGVKGAARLSGRGAVAMGQGGRRCRNSRVEHVGWVRSFPVRRSGARHESATEASSAPSGVTRMSSLRRRPRLDGCHQRIRHRARSTPRSMPSSRSSNSTTRPS